MSRLAIVHCLVDNQVAICHLRAGSHLMRHKPYRGVPRLLRYYIIKMRLKALVDIGQRLIEH